MPLPVHPPNPPKKTKRGENSDAAKAGFQTTIVEEKISLANQSGNLQTGHSSKRSQPVDSFSDDSGKWQTCTLSWSAD